MKKLSLITALLMFALTSISFGQITGSAHDFSNETWNPGGEICVTCHTPHNADATVADAPLWNHEVTTATFTIYSGYELDAVVGQPSSSSKLCLSCHDGTVAMDNFGGTTGGTDFMSGSELLGTDLSNDHPISFTYDAALATTDGDLADPTAVNSGLGSTIAADMLAGGTTLECASCHNVHNSGIAKLLVKANSASALCLTCHLK